MTDNPTPRPLQREIQLAGWIDNLRAGRITTTECFQIADHLAALSSREREAIDLITRFLAAEEAVVAEGERAEKTGRAWSSAPLVRQIRIVEEMRQFIGLAAEQRGSAPPTGPFEREQLEYILRRAKDEEYKHQSDPGAAWAYDRLVHVVSSLLDVPMPQFAGMRIVTDPGVAPDTIQIRASAAEPAPIGRETRAVNLLCGELHGVLESLTIDAEHWGDDRWMQERNTLTEVCFALARLAALRTPSPPQGEREPDAWVHEYRDSYGRWIKNRVSLTDPRDTRPASDQYRWVPVYRSPREE
jgi:hypothetical protein